MGDPLAQASLKFLVSVLFFSLCACESLDSKSQFENKENSGQEVHNVIDCSIYDMNGDRIWHTNGYRCLFFNDGSYLVATHQKMTMWSPKNRRLWSKDIPVHHQMNLSLDGKSILVISEEYRVFKGKLTKFDKLVVLDRAGRILKSFSFFSNKKLVDKYTPIGRSELWEIPEGSEWDPRVKHEYSHVNSFYEIPDSSLASQNSVFAKGNYIINMNKQFAVMVLDDQLSRILWSLGHDEIGNDFRIHDVQVTPQGKLLYFYNRRPKHGYSTIEEFEPTTQKVKILYSRDPLKSFYSVKCGGVQVLQNGNILFDELVGDQFVPREYSLRQKKLVWSLNSPLLRGRKQQVKRYDLSEFLKNNEPL